MRAFMMHIVGNLIKIIIFLAAFAIVAYTLIVFRVWSGDFTIWSLRTGDWGMIIVVTLIVTAVTMALTKLLQFEAWVETRPRPQPRARRWGRQ
ncbi:MAG: hypothetical protein NTW59_04340 [Candidatus Diapherotrites archaeon]|nr:hypothetical protein [Candidatus Diapherotrites archaeon]